MLFVKVSTPKHVKRAMPLINLILLYLIILYKSTNLNTNLLQSVSFSLNPH